jgi:hypothetical protein
MAQFVPDSTTLNQLKGLLKEVHVGDNEVQKKVTRVESFQQGIRNSIRSRRFPNVLCYTVGRPVRD